MKLDLQLYGVSVSATPAGVTLTLNGATLGLSGAEFTALTHALASIQGILERVPATTSPAPVRHEAAVAPLAVVAATPGAKKRGRPPRSSAATSAPIAAAPAFAAAPESASAWTPGMPKKRGRPPKNAQATVVAVAPTSVSVAGAPKKRGRPPAAASTLTAAPAVAAAVAATGAKKRGRPPKSASAAVATPPAAAKSANAGAKLRGRPPKAAGAASTAKHQNATNDDGAKRGPGRPRTDGTAVGAPRLVELVDAWMANNPGPKSVIELTNAAEANGWVEASHAAEYLERHVPRAPHLFVRLPDGRFRRRADKTPVEAPKAAKVLRRRGHDQVTVVRVEAPGT